MSIPESTHYPSLGLSHPAASVTDVSIVGLELKVYGLKEIQTSGLPIAAVIATHGRCNNQKQMAHFASGILGHINELPETRTRRRDVIVVTMDQRNHGDRTRDRTANLAYDANPRHLYDMAACIVGGCHDVGLIIDFLAAYLFPSGERVIDEWVPTGVSLGGNLTWRLLREEPRVNIAIPIIGLPFESFPLYLGARATKMGLSFGPPIYPPSLRSLLEAPPPGGCYDGKHILSIHGGNDTLVPFAAGREHIEGIRDRVTASGGEMEVWVKEGAGHVVTTDMVQRTAEWVWRWALSSVNERGQYI